MNKNDSEPDLVPCRFVVGRTAFFIRLPRGLLAKFFFQTDLRPARRETATFANIYDAWFDAMTFAKSPEVFAETLKTNVGVALSQFLEFEE